MHQQQVIFFRTNVFETSQLKVSKLRRKDCRQMSRKVGQGASQILVQGNLWGCWSASSWSYHKGDSFSSMEMLHGVIKARKNPELNFLLLTVGANKFPQKMMNMTLSCRGHQGPLQWLKKSQADTVKLFPFCSPAPAESARATPAPTSLLLHQQNKHVCHSLHFTSCKS